MEASGRLGPAAISFLFPICPTQSYLRTNFLMRSPSFALAQRGRCSGWPAIVNVKPSNRGLRQLFTVSSITCVQIIVSVEFLPYNL